MRKKGIAGSEDTPQPKGARQALMALRDLLAWQGRLIEEALHDLDTFRPSPARAGGPGQGKRTR
ncbi:MAG: hypothetical protein NT031_07710 [Planctomycetota bacterium]|nr:hypothetical protein [Planctomycetota bacterium]